MRRSNTIYSTIPKSQEWLIIKKLVNIIKGVLPRFYFFKERNYKIITPNFINEGPTWKCKRELG